MVFPDLTLESEAPVLTNHEIPRAGLSWFSTQEILAYYSFGTLISGLSDPRVVLWKILSKHDMCAASLFYFFSLQSADCITGALRVG